MGGPVITPELEESAQHGSTGAGDGEGPQIPGLRRLPTLGAQCVCSTKSLFSLSLSPWGKSHHRVLQLLVLGALQTVSLSRLCKAKMHHLSCIYQIMWGYARLHLAHVCILPHLCHSIALTNTQETRMCAVALLIDSEIWWSEGSSWNISSANTSDFFLAEQVWEEIYIWFYSKRISADLLSKIDEQFYKTFALLQELVKHTLNGGHETVTKEPKGINFQTKVLLLASLSWWLKLCI